MPNPRIFPVSDEVSAEQTEKDLSALQHSVNTIKTLTNGSFLIEENAPMQLNSKKSNR
jgi:hypothetical protein